MNKRELIEVDISGDGRTTKLKSKGLRIPRAPHFSITDCLCSDRVSNIEQMPKLTHIPSGHGVGSRCASVKAAATIAVVLEHLPIRWDGTRDEIGEDYLKLPREIQNWLRQ